MTVPVVKRTAPELPMEWISSNGWLLQIARPFECDVDVEGFDEWVRLIRNRLARQAAEHMTPMVEGDLYPRDPSIMTAADLGIDPEGGAS